MKRTTPGETKLVICVWHPFTEWRPKPLLAEGIRKRWPGMRVVHLPDYDQLPQELPDTDIFVGYSLRAKQLKDAKKLKWLHSTAAGVAQLMYPELRDSGIMVTNPSGVFSVPMAEHTMGLLLALARNFPDSVRQQDKAIWSQQELWDKPQRLPVHLGQMLRLVPQLLLRPDGFVLLSHRVGEISRQGQQQPHRVFRHRHGKYAARVGHHDPRVAQLGIHQLRHSRGGRMQPLQLLGVLQLLRAQRVAHENIRVWQLLWQLVVIRQMHHAHPRPALPNAFRQERLRPPFGKRVPHANHQFRLARCGSLHGRVRKPSANPCRSCPPASAARALRASSGQCPAATRPASISPCPARSPK